MKPNDIYKLRLDHVQVCKQIGILPDEIPRLDFLTKSICTVPRPSYITGETQSPGPMRPMFIMAFPWAVL